MVIIKFIYLIKNSSHKLCNWLCDAAIQATYSKCLIGSIVSKFILTIELKEGRSERGSNLETLL